MAVKAMTLVGLDVHARQTHAAVARSGDGRAARERSCGWRRWRCVGFLEGLGPRALAVYEAGPTGFGLARAARERGIEVRVVAPGSIPQGAG